MKFKLTNGEIIEAKKDCSCLDSIHTCPHWIHMDNISKSLNNTLIKKSPLSFAAAEIRRLNEKKYQMRIRKITGILMD